MHTWSNNIGTNSYINNLLKCLKNAQQESEMTHWSILLHSLDSDEESGRVTFVTPIARALSKY